MHKVAKLLAFPKKKNKKKPHTANDYFESIHTNSSSSLAMGICDSGMDLMLVNIQ